jgi:hypothetical protein
MGHKTTLRKSINALEIIVSSQTLINVIQFFKDIYGHDRIKILQISRIRT